MKHTKSQCIQFTVFLTVTLFLFSLSGFAGEKKIPVYTFGVVPQQSASKLARLWVPLLDKVGEISGVKLVFKTTRDIPTFESRLSAGEYDLAYMNPYHYTVYQEMSGYMAFAREGKKRIVGIVVVKKDSPIKDIKELAGTQVAFPAPAAFAATILPQANFRQMGIEINSQYVSSHDSVYQAVARGFYDAGGGIYRTLNKVDDKTRSMLRVLWQTESYTPHAFASHPRLETEIVNNIQEAFLVLNSSPEGKKLLSSAGFTELVKARNEDWNDVRSLEINLLK